MHPLSPEIKLLLLCLAVAAAVAGGFALLGDRAVSGLDKDLVLAMLVLMATSSRR